MVKGRRPDFIIIGATKSATTWLQRCLQQDPRIFMPEPELHFFSRHYDHGEAWYESQFEAAQPDQLAGEKSNSYFDEPPAETRLRAYVPSARLIVQLRNPIDRAYSDYCMMLRRGDVDRDIERYLGTGSPLKRRLLDSGRYHQHMTRYLGCFPREQLLVTLYDDMVTAPDTVLRRVGAHIGIDGLTVPAMVEQRVRDKNLPIVPVHLRRIFRPMKRWVAPFRQQRWFQSARAMVAKRVDYPPLTPALRERLGDFFRDDVDALGQLLDCDLSHWLSEPASRAA